MPGSIAAGILHCAPADFECQPQRICTSSRPPVYHSDLSSNSLGIGWLNDFVYPARREYDSGSIRWLDDGAGAEHVGEKPPPLGQWSAVVSPATAVGPQLFQLNEHGGIAAHGCAQLDAAVSGVASLH
jgi:hypothetical protein